MAHNRSTGVDNLSDINGKAGSGEIKQWDGIIGVQANGQCAHIHGLIDTILICAAAQPQNTGSCGTGKSAHTNHFRDSAVAAVRKT